MGNGETNANLGDGVQDRDGAYNDSEVDRTRSGGGERTTGAGGTNVVVVGDWETNGSLRDGVRECNEYQQPRRVRTGIEAGCASTLEEAWIGARPRFLEEDLERFKGTTFMGIDGEAEVGTLRGSARPGLLRNA